AQGGGDLAREGPRVRRGVVVELPGVHRADVGLQTAEQVHRVRVLVVDRASLCGDEGAAHEGRVAPDRHRRGAGGVADVWLVEQQAGLDVPGAQGRLQPGETAGPETGEVDRVRHRVEYARFPGWCARHSTERNGR